MSRRVLQTSFPREADSEMEICVQEVYWDVLLVRPVGVGKKQDRQIRRGTAMQSYIAKVSASSWRALCLGWCFGVVLNWGKGLSLYTPACTNHRMGGITSVRHVRDLGSILQHPLQGETHLLVKHLHSRFTLSEFEF